MYIEKIQHVYPINDIEDHSFNMEYPDHSEPYCTCNCGAYNIVDGINMIVKHNSFDGREAFAIDNPVRLN